MSINPQLTSQHIIENNNEFIQPGPFQLKSGKVSKLIFIYIGLFLFLAGGIAGYFMSFGRFSPLAQKACTMEAKICSDGSYVGRSGPNCDFAACPTPTLNSTANWKTYTNTKYGYEVKLPPEYTVISGGMKESEMDQTSDAIRLLEKNYGDISQSKQRLTVFLTNSKSKNTTLENDANEHLNSLFASKLSSSEKENLFKEFGYEIIDNEIVKPLSKSTFLGSDAYEYTINGNSVSNGLEQYIHPQETYNYIWFDTNNNRYLITFPETPLMRQIISTFRFLKKPDNAAMEIKQVAVNFLKTNGHDVTKVTINEPEKLGNLIDVYTITWAPQGYVGGGMYLLIGKKNTQWIIPTQEDPIYCEWVKSSGVDNQTQLFMGCQ